MIGYFERHWHDLLVSAGFLAGAVVAAILLHFLVFWLLRRLAQRKRATLLAHSLVRHSERPSRWIFPLLATLSILPGLPLSPRLMAALEHLTGLGLIGTTAWLVMLVVEITADVLEARYRTDVADNLIARRIRTQFQMVYRIIVFLVCVVTLAIMLMTFPTIKHIGMSILASAGLATLVVGMAMKGTLANLIAGAQIAFTQPFRIDDAVVIEGEWGWIEEMGTMYVVVRLWDLRRLVLPLSYFLDHPFQNWTRTNAELLANCFLYVDYSAPLDELRAELQRVCAATHLWEGKVCVLQVTDLDAKAMQLRALMDARNSSDAWDLRCLVREKLVDFLRRNHPECLPRLRAEVEPQQPEHAIGAAIAPASRSTTN